MLEKKITLEDLAELNDGTRIDMDVANNNDDGTYGLIKDEIEDFITRPIERRKSKSTFFETVPNTELKRSIENVLKSKNVAHEIARRTAQSEFDRKMARIKKIKSKTYRKMKRRDKVRKEEAIEVTDDESGEEDDIHDFKPVISFENKEEDSEVESSVSDLSNEFIDKAFEIPGFAGNEKDFLAEKMRTVQDDAPQLIEHSLPGWGDWTGEGMEFKKTAFNTVVEKKEGIRVSDRQDYKKDNVIINENTEVNEKYMNETPYGYSNNNYKKKLMTPISLEATSLRVFNRFVKYKKDDVAIPGEVIKPKEYSPEY